MNLIIAIVCASIAMVLTLAILRMLVGLVVFLLFVAAVVIAVGAGGSEHMGSGGVALVAALCGVVAGVISFPLIPHLMAVDNDETKKADEKINILRNEFEKFKLINNTNNKGERNEVKDLTSEIIYEEKNKNVSSGTSEEYWASKLLDLSPEIQQHLDSGVSIDDASTMIKDKYSIPEFVVKLHIKHLSNT
jgi:hypothetical protein